MSSTTEMVARMAQALAGAGADLGDERACIRALHAQKFRYADIVMFGDLAAKAARQNDILVLDYSDAIRDYVSKMAEADVVVSQDGTILKDRDGVFTKLVTA